jgi:Transposase DDE domain
MRFTPLIPPSSIFASMYFAGQRFGRQKAQQYSAPVNKSTGVRCDQTGELIGFYSSKGYPEKLRRIKFYDEEQNRTFVFLTNNLHLSPEGIASLYKHRWKIELFFKWIKQHLKIKSFGGTTENAVKTQVYIAVITYTCQPRSKSHDRRWQYSAHAAISAFGSRFLHRAFRPSPRAGHRCPDIWQAQRDFRSNSFPGRPYTLMM